MEQVLDFLNRPIIWTADDRAIVLWQIIVVPIAFIVAFWAAVRLTRFIATRLQRRGVNPDAVHLLRRVLYVLAVAALVLTALDLLNVPLTAFAFISGAIAIGVGFGAQNIINNFISGWILMWERPIRIGDFLEVDDAKGTVEAINTRSTRIRRVDGVHLMVPNSKLLENTVVNWTIVDRLVRTDVRVGVAYGAPLELVKQLLEQAVDEQEPILKVPKPLVVFEDFGDNALIFDSIFWVNASTERDLRVVRSDLRFRINDLLGEAGITIAFPQRDVHLDGSLRLEPGGLEPVSDLQPNKNAE